MIINEWISVKKALPLNGSFVLVKFCILFWQQKNALFFQNYFIYAGENITKWVKYWRPIEEEEIIFE